VTTKYVLRYHEAPTPIRTLTTKFGGQPVWLEEPSWPLSRAYGTPMQFICQIALPAEFLAAEGARMVYLFVTDDYDHGYRASTFEPDGGENALILQPAGQWEGPTHPLRSGPTLYRRTWTGRDFDPDTGAGWDRTPGEWAVELQAGEDPAGGAWGDRDGDDPVAWRSYRDALAEDKIGGTPVPTINDPTFPDAEQWRLLLQLNTKENEIGDPFFLNFADDGVGYAFLSREGRRAQFFWSR